MGLRVFYFMSHRNFINSQRNRTLCISILRNSGIKELENKPLHNCSNDRLFNEFKFLKGKTIDEYVKKKNDRKRFKSDQGHIYIIGNLTHGVVKIGFSKNPETRLATLQTGCPYKLSLIHSYIGTQKAEYALHRKYQEYKTQGEWFSYRGELKDIISNILSLPIFYRQKMKL
ncbi:GIY-YIG nuclease family protein [bacterium]|nr:MAG: GIY-YIG nuclease family protein [bacterium]